MNVCTHRGMTLTSEPCGNQKMFSCPITGGPLKRTVRCAPSPISPKFGEVCEGARDLVQFPCHEEGGLIFAVLDADSDVDIRAYLGAMMDDVAKKMDQWTYVGHRIIHGPNWKVAMTVIWRATTLKRRTRNHRASYFYQRDGVRRPRTSPVGWLCSEKRPGFRGRGSR